MQKDCEQDEQEDRRLSFYQEGFFFPLTLRAVYCDVYPSPISTVYAMETVGSDQGKGGVGVGDVGIVRWIRGHRFSCLHVHPIRVEKYRLGAQDDVCIPRASSALARSCILPQIMIGRSVAWRVICAMFFSVPKAFSLK